MKHTFFSFVVASFALAGGKQEKITGIISSAQCGINGMERPPAHDFSRAELPGIFAKKNAFYFVTNSPQSFLAQWPHKDVSAEGTVYEKDRAIAAKKLSVKEGDSWREVYADGKIIDDMRHRTSLASAVVVDGKWYCAECAAMHK